MKTGRFRKISEMKDRRVDDAVHEIMGFNDNHYQSLYHFTVGKPIEDPRLTTRPPYHHLKNR
jgi:hypothetical protein